MIVKLGFQFTYMQSDVYGQVEFIMISASHRHSTVSNQIVFVTHLNPMVVAPCQRSDKPHRLSSSVRCMVTHAQPSGELKLGDKQTQAQTEKTLKK